MNYTVITYSIYLLVIISLTVWVARTLFRNGRIFLLDIFHGNQDIASAVNNLLLVGFYLINIGYAVYTLPMFDSPENLQELIEALSIKIGKIILILGFMHFMNMFIFFRLRKRAAQNIVKTYDLKV